MATLLVTEFERLAEDKNGKLIMAPQTPAATRQTISYTAATTAGTGSAIQGKTSYLYLHALDAAAYISLVTTATVSNFDITLPSGGTVVIGVKAGATPSVI